MQLPTIDTRRPVELIRDATGAEHSAAESAIEERFFGPPMTATKFRRLLEAFLGLYRPLDAHLTPRADARLEAFEYRPRTPRLRADLRALGASDAAIDALAQPPDRQLPAVDDPAGLLGCLYVIEGSELGSLVLRERLKAAVELPARRADRFFHDDKHEVARRWRRFRDVFNRRVDSDATLTRAIQAARDTFDLYTEWFS